MIPDRHGAIRPCRGECVVCRMKGERVNWPDVIYVLDRLAMAFKGVFLFLARRRRIKIFNCNPAFYGSGCITCANRVIVLGNVKTVFFFFLVAIQKLTLTVWHTCETSGHVFQATLSFLCDGVHLTNVVDVE
jgi:hypothetical protein